jgi:hypothetical protein
VGHSKTALSAASRDKPQDRPHSPDVHSVDVDEADEPAQPELRATVADAPATAEDEHLSPLEEERTDLDHAAATTQAVTDTAGTTGTGGTTGPRPTAADDEGRGTAESTNDAVTRSPGRFDVGTQAHESGPVLLPEQVRSGQQVSAPVSIVEEVDVDRGPTTESVS